MNQLVQNIDFGTIYRHLVLLSAIEEQRRIVLVIITKFKLY